MAETRKPAAGKAKTKAATTRKPKAKATPARKPPAKRATPAKPRSAPKPKARKAAGPEAPAFDVAKLIDHPLVADLLAVGAMAAVAAIADHNVKTRTGEAESGSSKAVKAAGVAAATAIGKRLITEVDAIKKASGPRASKPGSKSA